MRNVRWRYAGRAAEIWHEHNRCNESAEHYLKAESCTQAAGCYGEFGFQSNAEQCYVKSKSWKRAAEYSNAFYIEAGREAQLKPSEGSGGHAKARHAGGQGVPARERAGVCTHGS
jgi:hypothetical protein